MKRTQAYMFTVDMVNGQPVGENAEKLQQLREVVKLNNRLGERKKYVKLQGRLGTDNPNAWKYKRGFHRRGAYHSHQCIRLPDAQTADVYVYLRPTW